MLLRELTGLGLRVLHAGDGALDRPVRWVYTTDLLDPARYLSGGELVVSGLVWRRDAADSERFVATLAAAGVAALAAGEAVFHGIPDDLLDACRHHDVPLLAVPEEVSFSAVTELVVGSLTAARGDRLAQSLGRQRQLLTAVAGGLGLDELTAQVGAATGLVCRVLSATGRVVAGAPLPGAGAVVAGYLTADRLPAVADGRSVFAVGPASESRLTSWFVAVDGAFTGWDAETTDAVWELVAITALDRARRGEGLRRDIADDAVALVADGAGVRPETAVRLRQAGLDPSTPLTVVVAGFAGRPDLAETARSVLADAADAAAVGLHDGLAVALVAGDTSGIAAALARLEPGLGPLRLAVGISTPAEVTALSGALRAARHARDLAQVRPGPLQVVDGSEITSHVALLAGVPDDVRRAFAARVLDPVLGYDAQHDAGLLETLEAFLDCSGSWSRTATRLHLHVNTVRYRIGRVEELTGRDLGVLADRVDVFLALRSR